MTLAERLGKQLTEAQAHIKELEDFNDRQNAALSKQQARIKELEVFAKERDLYYERLREAERVVGAAREFVGLEHGVVFPEKFEQLRQALADYDKEA